MAIDYPDLFTKLGKLVSRSNSYASLATVTLPADLQAIIQAFGTAATTLGSEQGPISGLTNTYAGFQAAISQWRTGLKPYCDNTITDRDTIITQLTGLVATDPVSVLLAIARNMSDNVQTVKGNTCAVGAVTAGTGNVGNGTALVDLRLDGYNSPLSGGPSSILYNGVLSELCVPTETMLLTCVSDSFTGGAAEGSEQWTLAGGQKYPAFDYRGDGSGQGASITTAHQASYLSNLSFETWSVANTPDNWTITAGAAGTDIFQETTAANVYRGSSALRFLGTGAVMPAIRQAFTISQLKGRRRQCFTARVFATGAVGAGNLTIKCTGTGYTAAASEQINVALAAIPGTYTLYSFYLNIPANIPSDLALTIGITGAALGAGGRVYIDSCSWSDVTYHGGLNVVAVSGSTPWVKGDRLTWTVTNSVAGNFQEFMRKAYMLQLPSKTDGTQTINDALAA